jgi:hypothetical protein
LPEPGTNRNVVYPDDLLRYYTVWDEKLLNTFPDLLKVKQPLFHILEQTVQEKASSIAKGEKKMDSILNCYYKNGSVNGKNGKDHHTEVSPRSSKVAYPY